MDALDDHLTPKQRDLRERYEESVKRNRGVDKLDELVEWLRDEVKKIQSGDTLYDQFNNGRRRAYDHVLAKIAELREEE